MKYYLILLLLANLALLSYAETKACYNCKLVIHNLWRFMRAEQFSSIGITIGIFFCKIGGGSEGLCQYFVHDVFGDMYGAVMDKLLNATYDCTSIGLCNEYKIIKKSVNTFQKQVLHSKPPIVNHMRKQNRRTIRIAQIGDIHMDPYYMENKSVECRHMSCCRIDSGPPKNEQDKSGYWGTVGNCDIPSRTVQSAIDYMANVVKPDLILWLGDTVYGDSENITREKTVDVLKEVTSIFKETFKKSGNPSIPIYPILGNHEAYPADFFDFMYIQNESWILKPTAEIWKEWIGEKGLQDYMKGGYYTTLVPNAPKLRIIGLNSLLYEINNFFTTPNASDPAQQIEWLEKTLAKAEKDHESVLMLAHVPTCCDRAARGSSLRLQALIERYSNIIKGVFGGHYHRDFVRVLKNFEDDTPFELEFVTPSLSTREIVNPAFTVINYDRDNYEIIEVEKHMICLLYTSPSPRDLSTSRMPSSA
eukprot:TRINITY_DN2039_c0_g1_i1.p1 TRINITY_DN2039_c0_g1~~TRINITY_DN2039_c0_g1_i1.p1  ORF type:complete len:476 (+),score=97.66 TRINITY_DN2039_c0_g1_i1:99-1526(+)